MRRSVVGLDPEDEEIAIVTNLRTRSPSDFGSRPQQLKLQQYRCENLKSHTFLFDFIQVTSYRTSSLVTSTA